jgi:hypothetical protein
LLLRFPRLEGADLPPSQHGALALGAVYAVQQIGFWLGGMAFPSLYDIVPGARARFVGFVSPSGPIAAANVGAVTLVLSGMLAVLVGLRRPLGRSAPGVLAGLVFCAAYSLLVAFGRSVARGLDYTLGQNLQHAYPALLAVIVTVMLGAWSWSRSGEARIAVVRSYRSGLVLLGLGGITLAAVNSLGTMAFLAELRHSYVAPKHELLHHVGLWHARAVRPPYFRIAPDCPGNDPLPWFDVYLRRNASGVSFADVLFPDTSFDLHRSRLGATALVDEISCADGAVAPEAVTGEWREASRSASVLARPDGRLEAIGPSGARSALMLEDHRVSAPAWRAEGILSHDAGYIFWRGAIPWRR